MIEVIIRYSGYYGEYTFIQKVHSVPLVGDTVTFIHLLPFGKEGISTVSAKVLTVEHFFNINHVHIINVNIVY